MVSIAIGGDHSVTEIPNFIGKHANLQNDTTKVVERVNRRIESTQSIAITQLNDMNVITVLGAYRHVIRSMAFDAQIVWKCVASSLWSRGNL